MYKEESAGHTNYIVQHRNFNTFLFIELKQELTQYMQMFSVYSTRVCTLTHTCVGYNPYFGNFTSCRCSSFYLIVVILLYSTQIQLNARYSLLLDQKFKYCNQDHLQLYLHMTNMSLLITAALVHSHFTLLHIFPPKIFH